jgi:hypothetical protein
MYCYTCKSEPVAKIIRGRERDAHRCGLALVKEKKRTEQNRKEEAKEIVWPCRVL